MTNTLSGPFSAVSITPGTTPVNKTWGDNAQRQAAVALGSLNPDLIGSTGFILSGCAASRHSSYSAAVLADTPLGFWRLDETTGALTALDSSGNGRALTVSSPPTMGVASLLTGDADACMTFAAGSSQYLNSTNTTNLPTGAAAITLECWIKISGAPGATQFILDCGDRSVATHHLVLAITSSRTIQLANGATTITSAALSTGAPHHLVGTYDGTNLRLYVDGALAAGPTAATNALAYTGNSLAVGSQSGATPGSYFSGQIDEAAIYNTALSAARVTAHYSAGTTATTTVDISSGSAYLVMSDGTLTRCTVGATTQTTSALSSTYHLYLQPDGTWYWSTSNSPASNSLAIADVATDGSGNAVTITDKRVMYPRPLLSGGDTAHIPTIVARTASPMRVMTTQQLTILTLTAPATGMYRCTMSWWMNNSSNANIGAGVNWTDGSTAAVGSTAFMANGVLTDGSHSFAKANGYSAAPFIVYAQTGTALQIVYSDQSGVPNDYVSALIEWIA